MRASFSSTYIGSCSRVFEGGVFGLKFRYRNFVKCIRYFQQHRVSKNRYFAVSFIRDLWYVDYIVYNNVPYLHLKFNVKGYFQSACDFENRHPDWPRCFRYDTVTNHRRRNPRPSSKVVKSPALWTNLNVSDGTFVSETGNWLAYF